jgi:hypothetical protein
MNADDLRRLAQDATERAKREAQDAQRRDAELERDRSRRHYESEWARAREAVAELETKLPVSAFTGPCCLARRYSLTMTGGCNPGVPLECRGSTAVLSPKGLAR